MRFRVRHAICLSALLLCLRAAGAVAAPVYHQEAIRIRDTAVDSEIWNPPLQQRVDRLEYLAVATITLAAVGAILAAFSSNKTKVGSAVAGALVVAVTSVRAQVYLADKDSAEAIRAGLIEYRLAVGNQFATYKENLDLLDQLPKPGPGTAPDEIKEIATQAAEWKETAGKAFEQLRTLHLDGGKLVGRARLLRLPEPPPHAAERPATGHSMLSAFPVVFAESRVEPGWMKSLPNDPDYLQDRGESICSASYGAREYARYDGRRRLAEKLRASAPNTPLNIIIKAIDSSVQDREQYSVSENGRIHTYVWVRLFAETARSSVRVVRANSPGVSWKGEGALPLNGRARVANAAASRKGTFAFDFSVVRSGRSSSITVESISTTEDGSVGSTRWAFDVSTAGGTRLFSIPTHRLDDSGKPTVCWPQANENLRGTANYDSPGTLRVEGFLGSDY